MGRHQGICLLNDIFVSDELASSKCVLKLRQGLDTLGIDMFARKFPMFLYLLRPPQNNAKLTVPLILHLLKPTFSEEGSNSLKYEKAVYSKFVKYLRDVVSGRRVTTLSNILEFVTGASEEPLLGFTRGFIKVLNRRATEFDTRAKNWQGLEGFAL